MEIQKTLLCLIKLQQCELKNSIVIAQHCKCCFKQLALPLQKTCSTFACHSIPVTDTEQANQHIDTKADSICQR